MYACIRQIITRIACLIQVAKTIKAMTQLLNALPEGSRKTRVEQALQGAEGMKDGIVVMLETGIVYNIYMYKLKYFKNIFIYLFFQDRFNTFETEASAFLCMELEEMLAEKCAWMQSLALYIEVSLNKFVCLMQAHHISNIDNKYFIYEKDGLQSNADELKEFKMYKLISTGPGSASD